MKLDKEFLDLLALGAIFLGSGGGGSPILEQRICEKLLDEGKILSLIEVNALDDNDLVVPVAYIGPLVVQETLPEIEMFKSVVKAVEQDYQKPVTAVMAGEIGGGNAFAPIISALINGLPLVDADLIGRAFPELQMSSLSIIPNEVQMIAYLVSPQKNVYRCACVSAQALEAACRQLCILEGASLVMAIFPMTGRQVKTVAIRGSYQKALGLGRALKQDNTLEGLKLIDSGRIVALTKQIEKGFLVGHFILKGDSGSYQIDFKNEYLKVTDQQGTNICRAPDIIAVIDALSDYPLLTQNLEVGQSINLYHYPADPVWYTPVGLQLCI